MIERPNVDSLLAGPLGQWLEQQAQVRAEAKAKSNRRFLIAAAIGIPAILLAFALVEEWAEFVAFAVFAGGGSWGYAPRAKAIKETKEGINAVIGEALGLSYSHDCEAGGGFLVAETYRMIPRYHRSSFEDLWSGDFDGLPFVLHEAHLQERRRSGKRTTYVTVFRGAILTVGARRRFHSTTLVERAGRHSKFFGGARDSVEFAGHRLDIVDMVDPVFDDTFSVYSDDQVESRTIVHPAYVERLLEVERAYDGEDVRALFAGGELTVVIESGNLFESGSLDPSQDRRMVDRTIDQFTALAELADLLNEGR